MSKGIGGHQSHAMMKDEWLTPPEIIKALGPFDLDPCSPVTPPWKIAEKTYNINDNGLIQNWEGFVWCNPPYGKEAASWLKKLADHNNGIALIFARTETAMFFSEIWSKASCIHFIEGRLFFYHVDGTRASSNGGAPSVLIGYGDEAVDRIKRSNIQGALVTSWQKNFK